MYLKWIDYEMKILYEDWNKDYSLKLCWTVKVSFIPAKEVVLFYFDIDLARTIPFEC